MRTKEGLDDAAGVAVVFDEDDEDEADKGTAESLVMRQPADSGTGRVPEPKHCPPKRRLHVWFCRSWESIQSIRHI